MAEGKPVAGIVIRCGRDRALEQTDEHLYQRVRSAPELGTHRVKFAAKQQLRKVRAKGRGSTRAVLRKARTATLQVRAAEITFRAPYRLHGDELPAVTLRVVGVFEQDPPEGQEPIEWILITSLPVSSFQEAMRVIRA